MASTNAVKLDLESPSQQVLPDHRRRWEDLALVMLLGFLPLVMSGTYLLFAPVEATPSHPNYRYAAGLIRELGILLLFAVLFRRQGRRLSDIGLSFRWLDLLRGAGLAVGSWMFSRLVSALISLIYSWSGSQPHYRDPDTIFGSGVYVLVLAYSIAAPFFEEILVRGYLMTELV